MNRLSFERSQSFLYPDGPVDRSPRHGAMAQIAKQGGGVLHGVKWIAAERARPALGACRSDVSEREDKD